MTTKRKARPRKRLLCFFIGHKWLWLRVNFSKAIGLGHLCGDAGMDLDCERCGYEWRDTAPWVFDEVQDVPERYRRHLQLKPSLEWKEKNA